MFKLLIIILAAVAISGFAAVELILNMVVESEYTERNDFYIGGKSYKEVGEDFRYKKVS